jgi:hypothetical protein
MNEDAAIVGDAACHKGQILTRFGTLRSLVSTPSGRPDRAHAIASALLLGLAGIALLVRIPAIVQPLGIDQSLWASAVRGMERGQRLYVDVWEQRPPGIYLSYWAAFKVLAGRRRRSVAGHHLFGDHDHHRVRAGTFAGRPAHRRGGAAVFATMTMPAWMYRYGGFIPRSISETFIVTCVGWQRCAERHTADPDQARILGFGLFAGAATNLQAQCGDLLSSAARVDVLAGEDDPCARPIRLAQADLWRWPALPSCL